MSVTETVKTKDAASWVEKVTLEDALSKDTTSTFAVVSGVVGVWALLSLVGAMVMVGGPLNVAKSWFSAVTGL